MDTIARLALAVLLLAGALLIALLLAMRAIKRSLRRRRVPAGAHALAGKPS